MYILEYEPWQLFSLIAIGTASIVCAFAGLKRLTKQTDNQTSVVLTIIGLIGTMYPAVIIFICIVALRAVYSRTISCGIYPIESPVALIVCLYAKH